MAKQYAEVQTPWTGTGTEEDSNRPLIGDEYALDKWEDRVGTPSENLSPEPNFVQLYIECEDTVMADIESDNQYPIVLGPFAIEEDVVDVQ